MHSGSTTTDLLPQEGQSFSKFSVWVMVSAPLCVSFIIGAQYIVLDTMSREFIEV